MPKPLVSQRKPVLTGPEALAAFAAASKRKPRVRGAQRTGRYASKREARFAAELAMLKRAGKVLFWLEQVKIPLADDIAYVCDFVVIEPTFLSDCRVRFVEVKGHQTEMWKLKKKLLAQFEPEIFARLEVR